MERQLRSGVASQGPAHEEKGLAVAQRTNGVAKELEDRVGVGGHGGEGRRAITATVASIVRHEQANALAIVERSNPIVVAGYLAIAMKIEDAWGTGGRGIEAA
jgi:hypothetical protein